MIRFVACVLVASLLPAGVASADGEDRPGGPPWTDVCAPMEQQSFRSVFKTDLCYDDFQNAFQTLEVDGVHQWMFEHRSCFAQWAHFSWLAFTRNELKMARLAWNHQLHMTADRLIMPNPPQEGVLPAVTALLQRGTTQTIGDEAKAHTKRFLDTVERDQSFKSKMDTAFASVTPICVTHGSLECVGAMNKALRWMYPRVHEPADIVGSITFSMVPFLRELFDDALTERYASRLALKIIELVDAPAFVTPPSIYEVGMEAFENDAERFWRFMAIYSTRGAAWASGYQLAHEETKPLFAALMVVSAGMGYLDALATAEGRAFSYLPGTMTTCYQPKPYHYWMTASFAHLLRQERYQAATAELVARLLGAMYEIGSDTFGRQPDDVFFVPTYDTLVNRARREITHHYLGAVYGSRARASDFDATYGRMISFAKALPEMSDEEMRQKLQNPAVKWQLWTDLMGYYFPAVD